MPRKINATRTRRSLVNLLKQEGAMDSQALAERLGVSAMAVRQHLYALQAEKLVTYEEEPRAMGRPAKLWHLTAAANQFFPDSYAELTLDFMQSVVEVFGDGSMEKLLAVRTRRQIADYRARIPAHQPLAQTLDALAQQRSNEGYMAEVKAQADGSFLLIENHCPIDAAANACTGLCEGELQVFQTILGEDTKIERTEHIVAGSRRCVYRVRGAGQ